MIGYRRWQLLPIGLASMGVQYLWQPGEQTAKCLGASTHAPPNPMCCCGIYALYDLDSLPSQPQPDPIYAPMLVTGAILAWGERFFAHSEGFRAERARIVALAAPKAEDHPRVRRLLAEVASDHRAEVVPLEQLRTVAREHGEEVPREARFDPLM